MIRKVFSTFSKSVTSGSFSRSSQSRNELFGFTSKPVVSLQNANFTSLLPRSVNAFPSPFKFIDKYTKQMFLEPRQAPSDQIRTLIKFSLQKGKRKTVKTVTKRFYRLHWGIWIRRCAGCSSLYAKRKSRRHRLLSHMFCNATQSFMLDKMVNNFWRKPKYYIEDPYAVYHQRENYMHTRKKPWRPEGVDYE